MQNAKLRKTVHRSLFTVHCLNGFTLLEIMIALAIVAAAVITTLHTVGYHADVAYEHTLTTRMLLLAKEKIAELETDPKNDKGIFPETGFSYETTVEDQEFAQQTEYAEIIKLKAVVRGYGKEIELIQYILKNTQ